MSEELQQMYQRTRKLMTMHKAQYPRDNVNRLYVSREKGGGGGGGGGGLTSIQDGADISIQRLEDFIQKHRGRLTAVTRNKTENKNINRAKIPENKNGKQNNCVDNFDRAKKNKPSERSWISSDNSRKQRHKGEVYQSKNRLDATE